MFSVLIGIVYWMLPLAPKESINMLVSLDALKTGDDTGPQLPTCEEEIVSKVFIKFGLSLGVEFSHGRVGNDLKYPFIKLESLIKALDMNGKLAKFFRLGPEYDTLAKCGPILRDFWTKYRLMHGSHEVFDLFDSGDLHMETSWPIFLHGDEGTTYKRDGCMVFSVHSCIGCGTASHRCGPVVNDEMNEGINFAVHALETRFLLGALLRDSGPTMWKGIF